MTATNERELQEKTPEVPKAAEAGLGERLAANPEAVKVELAQEAAGEADKFGTESAELTAKVEASTGPLDDETRAAVAGTEAEAMHAAGELAKDLGVEKKEKEPVIKSFEYRDSEGKLIGTATVKLTGEVIQRVIRSGKPEKNVRRMLDYTMTGPDGRSIALRDVVENFDNLKLDMYIPDDGEEDIPPVFARNDAGEAFVATRLPDNSLNLATMMHEIGHAEQSDKNGSLAELWDADSDAKKVYKNVAGLDWAMAKSVLEKLNKAFPENNLLSTDAVAELDEKCGDYDLVVKEEKEAYRVYSEAQKGGDAELVSKASDGWLAQRAILKEKSEVADKYRDRIRAASLLLVKIVENDAWLRADGWMKKIVERTGADVYAATMTPLRDAGYEGQDCESDVDDHVEIVKDGDVEIETSVREYMRKALSTYGAPTKKAA